MPPAEAAPAHAPQRQRFRVERLITANAASRSATFSSGVRAFPEQAAPARFSLPPFFHAFVSHFSIPRRLLLLLPACGEKVGMRGPFRWAQRFAIKRLILRLRGAAPSTLPTFAPRAVSPAPQGERAKMKMHSPRRILARVLPTATTTKTNNKKREAERREAHPTMAASCDAARALAKARSPFGAPLRRLPERANAPAQPRPRFTRTRGCGRYPHRHSRLSKAPCAPVVMPAGRCPDRPGAKLRASPAGTAPAPLQGSSREASLMIR